MRSERYLVDESRSVRSPWAWRGLLVMAFLAFGVTLVMAGNGKVGFAAAWSVISAGWLAISMWLWRQHARARGN
ncbi:MAG: hypothetical protein ACRDYY_05105 [Acidimicrobiales bacterium]